MNEILLTIGGVSVPVTAVFGVFYKVWKNRADRDAANTKELFVAQQALFSAKMEANDKMANERIGVLDTRLQNTITMMGKLESAIVESNREMHKNHLTTAELRGELNTLKTEVLPAFKTAIGELSMYYKRAK